MVHKLTDKKFAVFQMLRDNLQTTFKNYRFSKKDREQTLKMLHEDLVGESYL